MLGGRCGRWRLCREPRVQRPVDRKREGRDAGGEFRVLGAQARGNGFTKRKDEIHAAVEAALAFWHARDDSNDAAGRRVETPEPRWQRGAVADDDIGWRQHPAHPHAPPKIVPEVERQKTGVMGTAHAEMRDAAGGLARSKSRPRTRNEGDLVSGRHELLREALPDFFRCTAKHGRHGQEKTGDDGDVHAWWRRGIVSSAASSPAVVSL